MRLQSSFRLTRKQVVLTALGVLAMGLGTVGTDRLAAQRSPIPNMVGYPEDWSHHHLIYGPPKTAEETVQVQRDPRYWHQWFRRNVTRVLPDGTPAEAALGGFSPISLDEYNRRQGDRRQRAAGGLWGMSLGGNVSATGGAAQYPAKYTFSENAFASTASCSDFVVYNTGVSGATNQATIVAYTNLYSSCNSGTYPTVMFAYRTQVTSAIDDTASLSPILSSDGKQIAWVETKTGGTPT